MEENLVWKLISYIFQLYESYEIKFHTKISSFTVDTKRWWRVKQSEYMSQALAKRMSWLM